VAEDQTSLTGIGEKLRDLKSLRFRRGEGKKDESTEEKGKKK